MLIGTHQICNFIGVPSKLMIFCLKSIPADTHLPFTSIVCEHFRNTRFFFFRNRWPIPNKTTVTDARNRDYPDYDRDIDTELWDAIANYMTDRLHATVSCSSCVQVIQLKLYLYMGERES